MTAEPAGSGASGASIPPPFPPPPVKAQAPPQFVYQTVPQTPPPAPPQLPPAPLGQKQIKGVRQFGHFVFAALFFFLARLLARHGAHGLVSDDWSPLVEQAMFAFLLLFGYAGIGFSLDRQLHPISQQGLVIRHGWFSELGLGVAIGWAIAVACVLPLTLFGGIVIQPSFSRAAVGWFFADATYFALATLAAQIAFRGYPFQAAIRAIGELPAALMLSVLYGILYAWLPGASHASLAVCIALGLLLSMTYLRTRALWLAWGLQFGWDASRALLFGLPVRGISTHSPLLQGLPMTSVRLSGGNFGLDGSWIAFAAILIAIPVVYRATRDLSFQYNAPVLKPGGIPVDLDAAAHRQHEAATRPAEPAIQPLVQILPAAPPLPIPPGNPQPRAMTPENSAIPVQNPDSVGDAIPER